MTRINVYAKADETSYDAYTSKPELLGWFDPQTAECFEQDKRWDGNNMVGVMTGSQWVDEYLYRTKGGRWVRNHDAHRYMGGADTYEFLTDEQARDWLLRSECNNDAIERFFGEIEEERGPGRPKIGGEALLRLGDDLLGRVDAYASENGQNRAEAVRALLGEALTAAQPYTVTVRDIATGRRETESRHASLGAAVEAMRNVEDLEGMPSYQARVEHDGRPVDTETMED